MKRVDRASTGYDTEIVAQNSRHLAVYLREENLAGFCRQLKKKYQSLGAFSGTIKPVDIPGEELSKIERLVGFTLEPGKSLSVKRIIRGIENSIFYPFDLHTALEFYYDEEILPNSQAIDQSNRRWRAFFDKLKDEVLEVENQKTGILGIDLHEFLKTWLVGFKDKSSGFTAYLSYQYNSDEKKLARELRYTISAVAMIFAMYPRKMRLPLFASSVTKNPHFFDVNKPAYRYLHNALETLYMHSNPHRTPPKGHVLLSCFGVQRDDISNHVITYGIQLRDDEGSCAITEAAIQSKEPMIIPLYTLEKYRYAKAFDNRVYIVENPAIFTRLMEENREREFSLICGYGQIRTSTEILLDLLIESDATFFYSGDFDPEGLQIAQFLLDRYGEKVWLWRMEISDYELAVSDKRISSQRLKKLDQIEHPALRELAERMRRVQKAGYQENLEYKL